MYFNLATQGANLLSCTIKNQHTQKNKTTYFSLALWSKFTTQTNERTLANASYKMLVCFCVGKILCEICVLKLDFRLILGCLLANLHRNWHKKFDFDLTTQDKFEAKANQARKIKRNYFVLTLWVEFTTCTNEHTTTKQLI